MIDSTANISTFVTRALSADELDAELIRKWDRLASQSQEANPFLSPGFVLPFLKNRHSSRKPIFLVCENRQDQSLIGLGIFEHIRASRSLPLPHLIPFRCEYALRHGFLITKGSVPDFIDSLLCYMSEHQENWFGIEFSGFSQEQKWVDELRSRANDFGCLFQIVQCFESPAVELNGLKKKGLSEGWSSSRRKTMRRNLNRLKKYGEVDFQLVSTGQDLTDALERFLLLENSGWKNQLGTSILSCNDDAQFIREMVAEMATKNCVLISELRVGQDVAASAINLVSGCELFAFKIAYNKGYAEASPGSLHESQIIECLLKSYPQITQVDGCARSDSYLAKIWTDRIPVSTGLLTISTVACKMGKIMSQLRSFKRWATGFTGD